MANKKIVVLKLRELIYTAIFLFFGAILILLLIAMFSAKDRTAPEKEPETEEDTLAQTFHPGVYTTDLSLSGKTFTLQMLADADGIRSVDLLSLDLADGASGDEYISAMYPLMKPALETLTECLAEGIPLSEITFSVENQYTGALLKEAMEILLEKASTAPEAAD